ncbi:MAG: M15 family metallopeptidase [Gemmatimonadaceae bacterium]
MTRERQLDGTSDREVPANSTRAAVGQVDTHLCSAADAEDLGALVHRDAAGAFRDLRAAASAAGFDLSILSGFRSFDRQLSIWNRKASGELAVLDSNAVPLDIASLTKRELVFAILRWSALPGASRHHWGTDLDVYDAAAVPSGYSIELIPAEVEAGGMFAPLHEWLDARIANGTSFGFFRPYDRDRGGVAPERWHLSYAPLASAYLRQLTPDLLQDTIEAAELQLKETVLANLPEIYERFIVNTNQATT